ncbi:MAG TPA: YlbF family regulator [Anaerolineae bacterium]|nr:YlbF family regulator [Anaerolineae bacterium]
MSLSKGIREAAQSFGAVLKETDPVQQYLQAQNVLEADVEIYTKEQHMQAMYTDLATRQKAGESLSRAEVDKFNALRKEVVDHPLVAARDNALSDIKLIFTDAVNLISEELGEDYTTLSAS